MNDERDPFLVGLFAHEEPPADPAAFLAGIEARLKRARRLRRVQRLGAVAAVLGLAWWLGPLAIDATAALNEGLVAVMASPAAWGLGLLVAAWVLRRARS